MWKIRFLELLIIWLSVSCGSTGEIEYAGPGSAGEHVSIAYLQSLYEHAPTIIDREYYIVGRVVSSDQFGAFYKNLVVEDRTGGISLRINIENYYRKYRLGDTLNVACNSLIISEYGGALRLSAAGGEPMDGQSAEAIISIRNAAPAPLPVPAPLTANAIRPAHIGRLVSFDGVQFERSGVWCEAGRTTSLPLADRAGGRFEVRTTPYAHFAGRPLPTGSGYIEGVITGVYEGLYQLEVRSDDCAIMSAERFR